MTDALPGRAATYPPLDSRAGSPNAALLIDFDNVTMGIRSDLQNQLRRLLNSEAIKGKVAVQRAYADWRRYPQYIVPLSEASIDLIFAPAFGSNKKNATDIRLAIDALELVFTRPEIGTFILLSGDSDFSSLVLKLKEYGKWVIGVGIRESASDLLVQNCDEYFSYAELTGLTKEGEIEVTRRNPWELVVEATLRMDETGDVMRSDRLKQVMQQIDAHFDEKDAGFNRFGKFVAEAGRRGLLELTKMESGQYAVRIGPDANVPPVSEVPYVDSVINAGQPRKDPSGPVASAAGGTGLTLASGFALLRRVLLDLGASGTESADADRVRERMVEMGEVSGDPIFEPKRFQRLLRQAHDAALIDLVKDGGTYLLKLHAEPQADAEQPVEEAPATTKRKRKTTKTSKRRSRSVKKEETPPEVQANTNAVPETAPASAEVAEMPPTPPATQSGPPPERPAESKRRSVRGRGSSRSRKKIVPDVAVADHREAEAVPKSESKPAAEKKPTRRSARSPASTRRVRPADAGDSPAGEGGSSKPERRKATTKSHDGARKRAPRVRKPVIPDAGSEAAAPKRSRTGTGRTKGEDAGGDTIPSSTGEIEAHAAPEASIFKRMSAALQRVVLGDDGDET